MDSFQFTRGLIRYDSEANLAQLAPAAPKLKWKRLNIVGYGSALSLMVGYLAYSIATRNTFDAGVSQIRQPLYVLLSNGDIRNRYQIRINNKSAHIIRYQIDSTDLPAGALDLGNFRQLQLKGGQSALVQASVRLSPERAARTTAFQLDIQPLDPAGPRRVEVVRFDKPEVVQ